MFPLAIRDQNVSRNDQLPMHTWPDAVVTVLDAVVKVATASDGV